MVFSWWAAFVGKLLSSTVLGGMDEKILLRFNAHKLRIVFLHVRFFVFFVYGDERA